MAKVFITHTPRRRCAKTGALLPAFDFSAAERFGQARVVLDQGVKVEMSGIAQRIAAEELAEFSDGDYLLASGDPVAIAICAIEASKRASNINFLRWDRITKSYIKLEMNCGRASN